MDTLPHWVSHKVCTTTWWCNSHHPLGAQHSDSGCGSYSDMLSCWYRMYAHTYIHTYWISEWEWALQIIMFSGENITVLDIIGVIQRLCTVERGTEVHSCGIYTLWIWSHVLSLAHYVSKQHVFMRKECLHNFMELHKVLNQWQQELAKWWCWGDWLNSTNLWTAGHC